MNFDLIEQKYQKDIDAVRRYQNDVYDEMFSAEF